MKVYQRLAQAFKAEGTSAIFGIMGDANMYCWSSTSSACNLSKCATKARASAWPTAGRARRTPRVSHSTTCGPGTTQLATGSRGRARAESPLVAFCGEHPTSDDDYNQRFDQAPLRRRVRDRFRAHRTRPRAPTTWCARRSTSRSSSRGRSC